MNGVMAMRECLLHFFCALILSIILCSCSSNTDRFSSDDMPNSISSIFNSSEHKQLSESLFLLEEATGYGIIDSAGHIILQPIYCWINDFSEGIAYIGIDETSVGGVDEQGKILFQLQPEYSNAIYGEFHHGISMITYSISPISEKFCIIDTHGEYVLPLEYNYMSSWTIEGYSIVEHENGSCGIINDYGKFVVELGEYDTIASYSNGYYPASQNGFYGYIDIQGNIVIPFEYDYALPFYDEYAKVYRDNKFGVINKNNYLTLPLNYDYVDTIIDHYVLAYPLYMQIQSNEQGKEDSYTIFTYSIFDMENQKEIYNSQIPIGNAKQEINLENLLFGDEHGQMYYRSLNMKDYSTKMYDFDSSSTITYQPIDFGKALNNSLIKQAIDVIEVIDLLDNLNVFSLVSIEESSFPKDIKEAPPLQIFCSATPPSYLRAMERTNYDIEYCINMLHWNNIKYEETDVFSQNSMANLYVSPPKVEYEPELGICLSDYIVNLKEYPPSKIHAVQYVLYPIGDGQYTKKESAEIEVRQSKEEPGYYVFNIETLVQKYNIDTPVLYGVSVFVTWGNNSCEYAFLQMPITVVEPD